jgi:hypothetical protein
MQSRSRTRRTRQTRTTSTTPRITTHVTPKTVTAPATIYSACIPSDAVWNLLSQSAMRCMAPSSTPRNENGHQRLLVTGE